MSMAVKEVEPKGVVDLADDGWVVQARRRRKLAEHAPAVELEVARLEYRSRSLRAKASRLPVRSNGRKVAVSEAAVCEGLAQLLATALAGTRTPKIELSGSRQTERAARLLNELQAV